MALIDKVINILKENKYEYELINKLNDDSDSVICESIMVTVNKKNKEMHLSFNLNLKPDETALLTVKFIGLNFRYKYILNPSFIINKDGNVLLGDEAEEYYSKLIEKTIINNFLVEQQEIHMLHHVKPIGNA